MNARHCSRMLLLSSMLAAACGVGAGDSVPPEGGDPLGASQEAVTCGRATRTLGGYTTSCIACTYTLPCAATQTFGSPEAVACVGYGHLVQWRILTRNGTMLQYDFTPSTGWYYSYWNGYAYTWCP